LVVEILWDDAAFKRRVKTLAKERGLKLGDALKAAGITPRYFSRPSEGRSTNLILNLARALDVSPSVLFGPSEALPNDPPIDHDKLERIAVATRMMTAQLAALIYVVSDGSNADPARLMELVMDKVNGMTAAQKSTSK